MVTASSVWRVISNVIGLIMVYVVFETWFNWWRSYSQHQYLTSSDVYGLVFALLLPLLFSAIVGPFWGFVFGISLAFGVIYGYTSFSNPPPLWRSGPGGIVGATIGYTFLLSLLTVPGYGCGGIFSSSISSMVWEWMNSAEIRRREAEERRIVEEERKRQERERENVHNLIVETGDLLKEAEQKATKSDNTAWLRGVEFVLSKLDYFSAEFSQGEIPVDDAKRQILELRERANVISEPLSEDEKEKSQPDKKGAESCYEILGISENASHEAIEKARTRKLILYHPDRYRTLPDDVQQEAKKMEEKINQAANEAHKKLDRRS